MVLLSKRLMGLCLASAIFWLCVPSLLTAQAGGDFALVPEMEEPEGIFVQSRRERSALQESAEARRGLEALRSRVIGLWPQLRQVDWAAWSRYQLEETRGWQLPVAPGELVGQVMGHDEAAERWTLELRGPRLPARYDIVHRYLHIYASFDPATGSLDQLTVTIRGWVLE